MRRPVGRVCLAVLVLVLASCDDSRAGGSPELRSEVRVSFAPSAPSLPPAPVVRELCTDVQPLTEEAAGSDAVARLALLSRPFDGAVAEGLLAMQMAGQRGDAAAFSEALERTRATCAAVGVDGG